MSVHPTFRAVATGLLTIYVFWDIFKSHPGNRLVRCGMLTLSLSLVMGALLLWEPNFPLWYLGPLLFGLCILTMFFLVQRGYFALRNRRKPTE
jgi:hypothetical protein